MLFKISAPLFKALSSPLRARGDAGAIFFRAATNAAAAWRVVADLAAADALVAGGLRADVLAADVLVTDVFGIDPAGDPVMIAGIASSDAMGSAVFCTVVFCLGICAFLMGAVAAGAAFLTLVSLAVAAAVLVAIGFFVTVLAFTILGVAGLVVFAAAGFAPRTAVLLVAAFFPGVAVLDLAFASTLFTEVFGASVRLGRDLAARLLPLVAATDLAVEVRLRVGRAEATREVLLRALTVSGSAFVEGRAFSVGDFLAALVATAAALLFTALLFTALVLGGMA